jgi:hypothetical protein
MLLSGVAGAAVYRKSPSSFCTSVLVKQVNRIPGLGDVVGRAAGLKGRAGSLGQSHVVTPVSGFQQ